MKFKVGDKVRVEVEGEAGLLTGVVREITGSEDYPYLVDISSNYNMYCSKESLSNVYDVTIEERSDNIIKDLKKPIKSNRLEELTTALNTLGSLGIELDIKIYAEINGKKISL